MIHLTGKYYLTADAENWIIEILKVTAAASKTKKAEYRPVYYTQTLRGAIKVLGEAVARESKALDKKTLGTMQDVADDFRQFKLDIERVLGIKLTWLEESDDKS